MRQPIGLCARQLAVRRTAVLFRPPVGRAGVTGPDRPQSRSRGPHRSGSGSFSQLISSVENADRILLVREVPETVEQPPAVRRFDVLAGPRRTPRTHHRIERAVQMQRRHPHRPLHPAVELDAVRARHRPHHPAVRLDRAVRRRRDAHRPPVDVHRLVVRQPRPRPVPDQLARPAPRRPRRADAPAPTAAGSPRCTSPRAVCCEVGEHRGAPAARMRHRGDREPAHQLGPHHGRRPGEVAAQVVPDQRRVRLAEGAYDAGDVEREVGGVVAARAYGRCRPPRAGPSRRRGSRRRRARSADAARSTRTAGSRAAAAPAARRPSRRCGSARRWPRRPGGSRARRGVETVRPRRVAPKALESGSVMRTSVPQPRRLSADSSPAAVAPRRGCGLTFCRTAAVSLTEAATFSGALTFLNLATAISASSDREQHERRADDQERPGEPESQVVDPVRRREAQHGQREEQHHAGDR